MTQVEIEREADRLDDFVRRQQRECRVTHRRHPEFVRMCSRDYETVMLDRRYVAQWSASEEWYRNMRLLIDESCVDGPVVECASFWEHGREAPIGYVS